MINAVTYWNKVINDPECKPYGRRILKNEYEIKSTYKCNNTLDCLKRRWKDHPRITIEKDRIIEDHGRDYGIHSYTVITEI